MERAVIVGPGVVERFWFLLYPARCLACGKVVPPEKFFCADCAPAAHIPSLRRLDLEEPPGRTLEVRSPAPYTGGYRKSLLQYKFHAQTGLAGQLGRLTAGQALLFPADFTAVTYVPLSAKDRRDRGYDQSELLAKRIAKALGLPLAPLLVKPRQTRHQHDLSRAERIENAKDAYRASRAAAGKRVLLVDDIVTTGATLCQCAEALYAAGAELVYAVCAADAQWEEDRDAPSV